jgi:membrane associated rhomboid family serine protease
MREPAGIVGALPRPGRALKALLAAIAILAVVGAIVVNWAPGGERGIELYSWLAFRPSDHATLLERPWTILTSGVLTFPLGISHALWSLFGLYFLTTDLERRWGGARMLRFVALAVIGGNLTVLAGTFLPFHSGIFHPEPFVVGPLAAVLATTIAWAKENAHGQIRFMFFLPMSARTLYWITIGGAVLSIVFLQGAPEGALALLGGVLVGVLFSGAPSPMRALWLRLRLGAMRRRSGGRGITVQQLLSDEPPSSRSSSPSSPSVTRRAKGPPLRIVQGGLEEDLKNRKPPKDKRYLN